MDEVSGYSLATERYLMPSRSIRWRRETFSFYINTHSALGAKSVPQGETARWSIFHVRRFCDNAIIARDWKAEGQLHGTWVQRAPSR